MKNKKGFTLIELLAVIVILGIILVIAIPSISAAILNSRKNAYVSTANEFVDGLRMMTLTDASLLPTDGSKECKALTAIKLEKGSNTKSPFGKKYTENSQVCVSYDEKIKDYTYSICLIDEADNGISTSNVMTLSKKDVKVQSATCNIFKIKEISTGGWSSGGLIENGKLLMWGNNSYGSLGDGTYTNKLTPVEIPNLTNVKQIVVGSNHNVVLKEDGTVWTWGSNEYGQLGDGTYVSKFEPTQIEGLTDVIQVSVSSNYTLILTKTGEVWGWGQNSLGQLGNGTTATTNIPIKVEY